jgi:hypothetical protein
MWRSLAPGKLTHSRSWTHGNGNEETKIMGSGNGTNAANEEAMAFGNGNGIGHVILSISPHFRQE